MTTPPTQLRLPVSVANRLDRLAREAAPLEACGVLAGAIDRGTVRVHSAHPLPNRILQPDRFDACPYAFAQLEAELRGTGREVVGMFHSHPLGPEHPSQEDLGTSWPGLHLIVVPGRPPLAFRFTGGSAIPMALLPSA